MALNAITTAKEKEKTLKEQIQAMKDIIVPDPKQLEIFEDEKRNLKLQSSKYLILWQQIRQTNSFLNGL